MWRGDDDQGRVAGNTRYYGDPLWYSSRAAIVYPVLCQVSSFESGFTTVVIRRRRVAALCGLWSTSASGRPTDISIVESQMTSMALSDGDN